MTPLELTKDHKSKLLEMCRALFPEYLWVTYPFNDNIDQFAIPNKTLKDTNFLTTYHWFEFCMTHLAYKTLNKNKYEMLVLNTTFGIEINNSEKYHPIDFIYEEFKKP